LAAQRREVGAVERHGLPPTYDPSHPIITVELATRISPIWFSSEPPSSSDVIIYPYIARGLLRRRTLTPPAPGRKLAAMAAPSLRPLGAALGTEALGIDLAALDDPTFAWIERAFVEHPVLVFRGQQLDAEAIARFGRRFGKPRPHAL